MSQINLQQSSTTEGDATCHLGRPIARGRTADVHLWRDGQVLKLFHDWFELDDIEAEARIARTIHADGLPVPAVGGLVRVNGRHGLAYQRIDGDTMWQRMMRRPWSVPGCARRMAELHAGLHGTAGPADLPSLKRRLANKVQRTEVLPRNLQARVLTALDAMPDDDRLCHGDFHPGNILLSVRGETIIDWIDAARGNPLADLARTTILAQGVVEASPVLGAVPKAILRMCHARYLRHYFRLRPGGEDEYRRWLPIVAAARLSEGIRELDEWLIAKTMEGLSLASDT